MIPAAFKIEVQGDDITTIIKQRLESIIVTDVSNSDSDSVAITLADHNRDIALPELGAEMQVSIGYEGDLRWVGIFIIDEIATSDKAGTLSIYGKAADVFSSLKEKRTENHGDISLGDLLAKIAGRNNYEAAIDSELAGIQKNHLQQQLQSDQRLLTELAKEHEAVFKASGKRLVFIKKDASKNSEGESLPTMNIDAKAEGVWVDASITSETIYSRVKAHFKTPDDSLKKNVKVGDGDGITDTLPTIYNSEEEARTAATSRLAQLKRQGGKVTITMPGNMDASAERKLKLINHRLAGERIINRVVHTIRKGQVFTTTITATPSTK